MDGRRRALIIASEEYDHPGLSRLMAPTADAEALASVLGDREVGDFQVDVVSNAPAHVVQGHIEDLFADSLSDDLVLLHFSGHGLKSDSGELFFAARNTRPDRLGSTAVPADFVQRCMRSSRARSIVLFLDCCYGGAFGEGVTVRAAGSANVLESFPAGRLGGGRGRAVITASSAMEYAFEGNDLADEHQQQPSVFTTALVEGLASGEADRDEDGLISLNELYDYVYDRVRERNPKQTPGRDVELQGELYLARSRRRRVHALPIPADVSAALKSENMFARVGAVTELRSRMRSTDLGAALGAYEALMEVSRSDIRYVQEAAAEALGACAVVADPAGLHFGTLSDSDLPLARTIRLTGPPLAVGVTASQSAAWISVDVDPPEVRVSIDPTETGRLVGTVTLTGATGHVVIPVTAEITSTSAAVPEEPGGAAPVPASPAPAPHPEATTTGPTPDAAAPPAGAQAGAPSAAIDTRPEAAAAPRPYWKLSGITALVSGSLMLLCIPLAQQYGDSTAEKDPTTAITLLYLGVTVIVLGCLTLRARWRTHGLAAVMGASPVGIVVAFDMVNILDDLGNQELGAGFWCGFVAPIVLLAAGVLALAGARLETDARVAALTRRDWACWCVLVLAVVGALPFVWTAKDLYSDRTGLAAQELCVAVLAVLVPLAAVLSRPVLLGRWMLIGWCLACVAPVLATWLAAQREGSSAPGMWLALLTLGAMAVLAPLMHPARRVGTAR